MSRAITTDFRNHLAQTVTTLAFLMKITRQDGMEIRLTDHDVDITYEGDVYSASQGGVPSASSTPTGLDLSNLNVSGAFLLSGISRTDLLGGKYDYAKVEVFRVNWRDLTQGTLESFYGRFGEAKFGDREFQVDCFGLEHLLQQKIGDTYSKDCRAHLGDTRCKVDLNDYTESGVVIEVVSQREIQCTLTDIHEHSITGADWFADGSLTWLTGDNTGLHLEIKTSIEAEGIFTLGCKEDAPFTIGIGDSFSIVAGCRKRYTDDCKDKFDNTVNFRGFHLLPGSDAIRYTPRVKLGI